jgi:Fur family ferric uptake transcriptional regulator
VTGPRQAILDVLRRHPRPLRIKEIRALLGPGDCDLATIYRSVQLLQRMGMVKRVDLGGRGACFELLAEGDDGHHHHLVCTGCQEVLELDHCLLHAVEEGIARASGFKRVTHRLEFFGLCPRCQ